METKRMMSSRLKKLLGKLSVIDKTEAYLERELSKLREHERKLRGKIKKERKAIALVNQAKKLR